MVCGSSDEIVDSLVELPGVDGVYYAIGSIHVMPIMSMSAIMVVIKVGDDLSIINPRPLTPEGEEELRKLGTVKRVIRLGYMHGSWDEYYKKTFNAELWAPGPSPHKVYGKIPIDVTFTEQDELFPGSKTVIFTNVSEAVVAYKGVLFTCDSLHYYGATYKQTNLMGRMMLPKLGLKELCIGGPWLKEATPKGGSLQPDFERIMDLEFDKLLAAHGEFCESGAKDGVRTAIDNNFK